MPTPNPYQPPGSRDVAWTDRPLQPSEDRMARTKSPRRLISFLTLQFVAFVPTMFVLHVLWFCFGIGLETAVLYLLNTPVSLAWIAGGDIALWLPHAVFAVFSRRVRRAGPVLNGILAAFVIAISMGLQTVAEFAQPQITAWLGDLPFYIHFLFIVTPSLIVVAFLGQLWPSDPSSPLDCIHFSRTSVDKEQIEL